MARTDIASRVIDASPMKIYEAFVDPDALVTWLPPQGMSAELTAFEPRPGGGYRMVLTYDSPGHSAAPKSSDSTDVVAARFTELEPGERVVQLVEFDSEDPAFAGTMKMTWSLTAALDGTEVRIACENVPAGIHEQDHLAGLSSTLENLAAFCEED